MLICGILFIGLQSRRLTRFLGPLILHLKMFIVKSLMLILDQSREQQILGHREEAQTRSRMMMIVHLHKSGGYFCRCFTVGFSKGYPEESGYE